MGLTTPNIGIYIPAAGETNYDASFASGMVNIDQHDHSGGPNKGLPIASSGLADGSVTYPKLNANVADNTTGIGTNTGPLANQLIILGLLKNIFQLVTTSGFISKDGTNAHARTLQPTANQTTVTNGAGVAGDPVFGLVANPQVSGISFDAGANVLNAYSTNTFTPQLQFGGGSTGITYVTQFGQYTRVGNLCFVNIFIHLSNKGSSTGGAAIANLPFSNLNVTEGCRLTFEPGTITFSAGNTGCVGKTVPNTATMELEQFGTGISATQMDDTNFANGSVIGISGVYQVI